MIKVGICASPLKSGHKSRGVGFYTKNLLDELKKRSDIQVVEFDNDGKLEDVDLLHFPYFDLFFRSLPLKKKFPTVVTIHDVTPLVFPKYYPPGIKGKLKHYLQRTSLFNVKAVITDSIFSKVDIEKYLKVSSLKIYPIHLAPNRFYRPIKDEKKFNQTTMKYDLPGKFALFVGSVNWNKNLLNIALACLKANLDLVLVGKDFENRDDLDHVEKKSYREFLEKYSNNPKIHILGFISDEEMLSIFNMAQVLLYCSFYEGFGLPILEAQSCGIPVITSNVSSMPEIAGQGAYLIDPNNISDISAAITNLTTDKKLRDEIIKKGFENVKRFSWEKTAEETVNVYKKVLKK